MYILKNLNFVKIALGMVILFIGYLLFYQLGSAPLENWDEAWYGEATKEIIRTKNFIVLHWNHTVWLDKPPLFMWITAIFSFLLGLSELSMRLPSAISGFVIILCVTIYCYKKYGLIPSAIALSTLALNNIFIWRARSGNIDTFVSLLIFFTFFLILSNNKYKYYILGLIFSFIYLTKASLVFLPLLIFIAHEVLYKRKDFKKVYKQYIWLFILFVIPVGVWLLLGYLQEGIVFINYYLFYSDQGVASFYKYSDKYFYHAYYSLQRRFFWLFLIGAFFALRKIKSSEYFLLLSYAFLLLFQLSFTQKDNNWYLIPSMPFWSILCAFGAFSIFKILKNNRIIILFFIVISLYISYKTYMINIRPILDTSSTTAQAQSARELKKITQKNEVIVRLDHLYPTTIYYSDRKVLASPPETSTRLYWMSRDDLIKKTINKEIKWINGSNKDIEEFVKNNSSFSLEVIKVNSEESIIKVL